MADLKTISVITQETYSYNNSTIFYSLVNPSFRPYYQRTVRKSQQWLDGYDPVFHRDDIFSSRIASKLINGLTTQIFGRGLVFVKGKNNKDPENKALNYISHKWADKSDIQNAIKQAIGYALPIGTSALKINKGQDVLWVQPLRLDYFYFSTDSRKKVNSLIAFIRAWQSTEHKTENYFLVEKRYFGELKEPYEAILNRKKFRFEAKKRIPLVEYKIYKYTGLVDNDNMPNSLDSNSGINYKSLPDYVKSALASDYSTIMIDKPTPLPFVDYLGVEVFQNEGGDITNPTLPFGRALVYDCLTDFMEYDIERSCSIRDLKNAKGRVGIPKMLTQSTMVPGTAGNMTQNVSMPTLPDEYEMISGLDPTNQKPIISQFEIRAAEHETKQNAILKAIATAVGMSPRVIGSYLVAGGEKTDDQIQSEDDTITQWIKNHRQDYVPGINRIIECVLNYYGYSDNVEVRFASDGLVKGDKQLESIRQRLEMNLLTLDDAIRELNPDLDEVQLQEKITKALNAKAEAQQAQQNQFDETYGDLLTE